ncbi:phage head closure protein [Mangrovibacillus cuniculi]|uniref:Phage head closure protein n=1 Tax=Mangrovibacillus cuniculi TaxID=2593652 RepID=A0A7S8CBY3_9BACI|nr:phage head closure protein [Mangrovibacillus cuniculi]QPC47112.1 phage head closure protein [Mangrovibacillus cuniculi]
MKKNSYNPKQNTGSFRNRITILSAESIMDNLGQIRSISWTEYKRAWAMIKTVKGSEYISAGANRREVIYRFIVPYTAGITNEMRIKYQNRYFDVIEPPINDDELGKTLTILTREVLPHG